MSSSKSPLHGAVTGAPGQTTQADVNNAKKHRDQANPKKADEEQSGRGPRPKKESAYFVRDKNVGGFG